MWHDGSEYWDDDNEDNVFKGYDGYKKRKVQQASIKEELLPVPWHPSGYWDWCILRPKKKRQKNCGHNHGPFCIL